MIERKSVTAFVQLAEAFVQVRGFVQSRSGARLREYKSGTFFLDPNVERPTLQRFPQRVFDEDVQAILF